MTEIHAGEVAHERGVDKPTAAALMGAGLGEILGGAATVALTIIGLAQIMPDDLLGIAALTLGGTLMFEGGAIATRYHALMKRLGSTVDMSELGGGLSAEFLGGAGVVALGIIALAGVYPVTLLACAAITAGAALAFGASMTAELSTLGLPTGREHEQTRTVARSAIATASGLRVLAGLGAVTLGILALIFETQSTMLSQVAFLSVGGALLLSGTAIGGKVLSIFRH